MGKGIIKSHLGDAEYSVEIVYDTERMDAKISTLTTAIADLTAYIATLDEEDDAKEIERKTLAKTALQKQLEFVSSNKPSNPTVSAWCADLTEDLAVDAEVATIEVPGEVGRVLVGPGFNEGAPWSSGKGILQPGWAANPYCFFYNLCMLPGWQKWMPTYRIGTIGSIDQDAETCTVTLESEASSQQNLDVNQDSGLEEVTFSYMNCDIEAFEEGDAVVVQFADQTWESARVIGFKNNPQPCPECPSCRTMEFEESFCSIESGGEEVELYFKREDGFPDVDCVETIEAILGDGLEGDAAGSFSEPEYEEADDGRWKVVYTSSGALCDPTDFDCPVICDQPIACCFAWADDNPETVDRNDFVGISVVGGKGPYTWEVSGTGFSLGDLVSASRSNTLFTDGAACGPASITVTDDCGQSVTGGVRSTEGSWDTTYSRALGGCDNDGMGWRHYYFSPICRLEYLCGAEGEGTSFCAPMEGDCAEFDGTVCYGSDLCRVCSANSQNWSC